MASDHARVLRAIWQDEDFLALSMHAQRLYLLLLSQPKLTFCGSLDYRPDRWAKLASDASTDAVEDALSELEAARYVVVDHDTGELVIRSWVRHDGVCSSPNLIRAMWKAWEALESKTLRRVVLCELPGKAFEDGFGSEKSSLAPPAKALVELAEAKGSANPSANPSAKGSATPVPSPAPLHPGPQGLGVESVFTTEHDDGPAPSGGPSTAHSDEQRALNVAAARELRNGLRAVGEREAS